MKLMNLYTEYLDTLLHLSYNSIKFFKDKNQVTNSKNRMWSLNVEEHTKDPPVCRN